MNHTDDVDRQMNFDAYVTDLLDVFGEPDPQVRAAVAVVFDRAEAALDQKQAGHPSSVEQ